MQRRVEYLVCKRDGRHEWLRAAKLARSIATAIDAAGAVDDSGDSVRLTAAVIAALRRRFERAHDLPRCGRDAPDAFCTTAELSLAAERALWAAGHTRAAALYAEFRFERGRRRELLVGDRGRLVARAAGLRARVTFDHN